MASSQADRRPIIGWGGLRRERRGEQGRSSLPPCCPLKLPQTPLRNCSIVKRRKNEKRVRRRGKRKEKKQEENEPLEVKNDPLWLLFLLHHLSASLDPVTIDHEAH